MTHHSTITGITTTEVKRPTLDALAMWEHRAADEYGPEFYSIGMGPKGNDYVVGFLCFARPVEDATGALTGLWQWEADACTAWRDVPELGAVSAPLYFSARDAMDACADHFNEWVSSLPSVWDIA